VRDAAARVAQITDFDARYSAAIEEVKAEAAAGAKLGVNSTPTFFVNGRKVPAMPPEAMDALIDYELKRGS
jgi:protein-disulfide isomerase